jgi:hypothetical protein
MTYVFGVPAVLFLIALVYGGLTGRVRLSSGCCAVADPRKDLRMRAAFEEADLPERDPSPVDPPAQGSVQPGP